MLEIYFEVHFLKLVGESHIGEIIKIDDPMDQLNYQHLLTKLKSEIEKITESKSQFDVKAIAANI